MEKDTKKEYKKPMNKRLFHSKDALIIQINFHQNVFFFFLIVSLGLLSITLSKFNEALTEEMIFPFALFVFSSIISYYQYVLYKRELIMLEQMK